MAVVTIRDVRKSFGPVEVLHGVSIDIDEGEFVVLVGPSGCGKSTLLRMLAGLEHVTSGEIVIGNRVVNDLPPKERDIAMVFQNYALYPHLTVADNMAFSLMLKSAPKSEIAAQVRPAAEILGLTNAARPLPAAALGRAAPAGGDGAGDRARPAGVPVRRAAVEPRRQAARLDARRDQEPAPAAEDHHGLRHARPDRGDDHGRQDRGHARRPGRAGRRAARALRHAGEPVRGGLHRLAGDEHADRPDRRRATAGASSPATASRCRSAGRWRRRRTGRWSTACARRSMHLGGEVPLHVDVVEPTGSETHVVARLGATEVVGVFRERVRAQPGEEIRVVDRPAGDASLRRRVGRAHLGLRAGGCGAAVSDRSSNPATRR